MTATAPHADQFHAIILYGRGAAAPEDEKVCLDLADPGREEFPCAQAKGSRTYWWYDPER